MKLDGGGGETTIPAEASQVSDTGPYMRSGRKWKLGNAGTYEVFAEFKEEAARLAVESSPTIADVAREIGVNETTLGTWVANTGQSMWATSRR